LKSDGTFLTVIANNDLKGTILESATAEIDDIISEPIVIAEVIKTIDKYTSKFKSAALV
jgi:hypothetical protein